jgi:hypothetical protein
VSARDRVVDVRLRLRRRGGLLIRRQDRLWRGTTTARRGARPSSARTVAAISSRRSARSAADSDAARGGVETTSGVASGARDDAGKTSGAAMRARWPSLK